MTDRLLLSGTQHPPHAEQAVLRHHRSTAASRCVEHGAGRRCLDEQLLSYNALRRARTTLDDFTTFYLPLHGLERADFFRWLPILVFIEGCIYQLDETNEDLAREAQLERSVGSVYLEHAIRSVLVAEGLMNEEVAHQMDAGLAYWELERQLCASMLHGRSIEFDEVHSIYSVTTQYCASRLLLGESDLVTMVGPWKPLCPSHHGVSSSDGISLLRFPQVLRASALKSFDYRLLHALLSQLSGRWALLNTTG